MDVRTLILQADAIARSQGLSQKKWSTVAGYAVNGQTVSRIISKGNCKLSTMQDLLNPLGYELAIIRKEDV